MRERLLALLPPPGHAQLSEEIGGGHESLPSARLLKLLFETGQPETRSSDQRAHPEHSRETDCVLEVAPGSVRYYWIEPKGDLSKQAECPCLVTPFVMLPGELERPTCDFPRGGDVSGVEMSFAEVREQLGVADHEMHGFRPPHRLLEER